MTTTFRRAAPVVLAALLFGCSGDDDDARPDVSTPSTASPAGSPVGSAAGITSAPPAPTAPPDVSLTVGPTFATAPEIGVPGLDSGDAFCAAWSEFGGSWQVMIQSTFAGTNEPVARLEVIAAPAVTDAYDAVFAAWPPELESEREVVADSYFGAFQRRSQAALDAVTAAGADGEQLETLAAAWRQGLASYDPATATLDAAIDPALEPLVAEATSAFEAARVPIVDDPSMVITAETPLTDEFLATACPDQGWIVGQDVVGDADQG